MNYQEPICADMYNQEQYKKRQAGLNAYPMIGNPGMLGGGYGQISNPMSPQQQGAYNMQPGNIFGHPIEYWVQPKIQPPYAWNSTGTDNELEAIRRAYSEEAMRIQRDSYIESFNKTNQELLKKDKIVCDKRIQCDIIDI